MKLFSSVPFLPLAGTLVSNAVLVEPLTLGQGGVTNRQEITPFQSCVTLPVDRAGFRSTSTGTNSTARIYVIVYGTDSAGRPSGECLVQSEVIQGFDGVGYYDAPIDFVFEAFERYWVGIWYEVAGRNIAYAANNRHVLSLEVSGTSYNFVESLRRTAAPITAGVSPEWVYSSEQHDRFSSPKAVFFRVAP